MKTREALSRDLRRRYESWYHTSLRLIEDNLPYQVDEFKAVYDIMISYVTLNRFAATTDSTMNEVQQWHRRGYVDIYLDEFANVIDRQANLLRTLLSLPDDTLDASYRCFLTGFAAPYELRENPSLVFVIMPFAKEFDDVYQFGIKNTAASLGLQCKRSDEIIHTQNVICTSICQPIRAARYIIVDITRKNPNVFYELGLTHARLEDREQAKKKVLIITQDMEDLPFDLRTMNIIHYRSIGDLSGKLTLFLTEFLHTSSTEVRTLE